LGRILANNSNQARFNVEILLFKINQEETAMSISKTENWMSERWLTLRRMHRNAERMSICLFISIIPGLFFYFCWNFFSQRPLLFIGIAVALGFCGTMSFSILWTRDAGDRKLLKEANAMLAKLCCLDPLTGLYSRQHLETAALSIVKEASRKDAYIFSVIMDIDNLKNVNDSYGHAVGDEIIRKVAVFLRRIFRDGDHLCRIGGDEFEDIGIIDSPEEFLDSLSEKLQPFLVNIEGIEFSISVSYGCAFEKVSATLTLNKSENDLQMYAMKLHDAVYKSADAHMYAMKKGRK